MFRKLALATAFAANVASAQAQEIKVGVILPYTGVAAELGQQTDRGIEQYLKLNADKVKPYTIKLIKRDEKDASGANAKVVVQELLTQDKVDIMLGWIYSPNAIATASLINAGKVSTQGFEADLTARITSQLTLTASIAKTDATVKSFNCPPGAAVSCDINGKMLPFAPELKGSLRAKYLQPLSGSLTLELGMDATRQSKTNFDLSQQPDSVQPGYSIFNATVALASTAGWRVAVLGKNLGDQSYATFIQSSGNHINRYVPRDDKRYFGVNLRYDF